MKDWTILAALAASLLAADAGAGERSTLAALPVMRAGSATAQAPQKKVPGVKVRVTTRPDRTWADVEAETAKGYCLIARDGPLRLESSAPATVEELWRFRETGDSATLEQTHLRIAAPYDAIVVKDRAQIALARVARTPEISVWGYRETSGNVVLLTAHASGGVEAKELAKDTTDGMAPFVSSACSFGATRLPGKRARSGALAALTGSLPPVVGSTTKEFRPFAVHASLAQVGRDPAPMLAVRIRAD